MDSRNYQTVGEWTSFEELALELDPGDLVEIKRPGFEHWGVAIGVHTVVHKSKVKKDKKKKKSKDDEHDDHDDEDENEETESLKSIQVEEDEMVIIHVTGDVMSGLGAVTGKRFAVADIRIEELSRAVGKDVKCRVNNKIDELFQPFPTGTQIVFRGLSKLGQHDYNVWNNNCQHWASWCRNGHLLSHQVDNVEEKLKKLKIKTKKKIKKIKSKIPYEELSVTAGVIEGHIRRDVSPRCRQVVSTAEKAIVSGLHKTKITTRLHDTAVGTFRTWPRQKPIIRTELTKAEDQFDKIMLKPNREISRIRETGKGLFNPKKVFEQQDSGECIEIPEKVLNKFPSLKAYHGQKVER